MYLKRPMKCISFDCRHCGRGARQDQNHMVTEIVIVITIRTKYQICQFLSDLHKVTRAAACGWCLGMVRQAKRAARSSLSGADVPNFREELERIFTAFTANTGLLEAAEGRAQLPNQPAVDPDNAGLNF